MSTNTRKKTGPDATDDIDHEVVTAPKGKAKKQEIKLLTLEEEIHLEVSKLPDTTIIEELQARYNGLTVAGVEDKDGYKKAKEAWGLVRTTRTGFEKMKDDLKRRYITIGKALDAREKQLVDAIRPLEDKLQRLWKTIDEEKTRLEEDEKLREQAALEARLVDLGNAGMTFSEGYYQIGGRITIDIATLRIMPLEKFEDLLSKVHSVAKELKDAKDLADREADDRRQQLEREKREQVAANKRLRGKILKALGFIESGPGILSVDNGFKAVVVQETDVFEVSAEQFDKVLELIEEKLADANEKKTAHEQQEQERRTKQERKNRDNSRMHALAQAGLRPHGAHVVYEDDFNEPIRVGFDELLDMEDKAFSDRVVELSNQVGVKRSNLEVEHRRLAEEQEKLKVRKDGIAGKMEGIGFRYNYASESFGFDNKYYTSSWTMHQLLGMQEACLLSVYTTEEKKIAASKQQLTADITEENKRLELERQAELGDDDLFTEYLKKLAHLAPPPATSYKAKKSKTRQGEFNVALNVLLNKYMPAKKEVKP